MHEAVGSTGVGDEVRSAAPAEGRISLYTGYALGFLTLISTLNYLDRSVLGLALPLIKREMHTSDTMLGFVSGFAFVLFYSTLGVPIAWLAERWSRRNVIAIGFAVWSLMTVLTGYVANIWQLAIARFVMGAGEAAGVGPSNSMIAGLFSRARRPLALAVFGCASSVSALVGYPILGWIGAHHGWRAMFIASGAPGLVLAALFLLTVKEPPREAHATTAGPVRTSSLPTMLRFLLGSRTYLLLIVGAACMGANLYAASAWDATFLQRVHGMPLGQIAASLGPVRGITSAAGVLALGVIIDRLGARDPRWRLRLPAIACFLVSPAQLLFLLTDPMPLWLTGYGLSCMFILIHQPAAFAAGMSIARPDMRAVSTSILLLAASLLGQAGGPLVVGALNDALQPTFGTEAIRYSLLITAVSPIIGGLAFWAAVSSAPRDIERASQPA